MTVGIVVTDENADQLPDIIQYAHDLGVADIRVISAAQTNIPLQNIQYFGEPGQHPILEYRLENAHRGRPVRGICESDPHGCPLVLDDIAATGEYHYPCIIHLREAPDKPIGRNDSGRVRQERCEWFLTHDVHKDPICQKNCLDVCVDYNRRWCEYHQKETR